MFEEERTEGMSGFAAYSLGRMAAESDRDMDEYALALRRRFSPSAPTIDVNALLAENEMLRQQLAETQAALEKGRGVYNRLDAWANEASKTLRAAGLLKG